MTQARSTLVVVVILSEQKHFVVTVLFHNKQIKSA